MGDHRVICWHQSLSVGISRVFLTSRHPTRLTSSFKSPAVPLPSGRGSFVRVLASRNKLAWTLLLVAAWAGITGTRFEHEAMTNNSVRDEFRTSPAQLCFNEKLR